MMMNVDVLDLVLGHVTRDDLVRLATVHSSWHAATHRRLHLSIRFNSPSSARRFIALSRQESGGAIVASATGAPAIVRAYILDGSTAALLPSLLPLAPHLGSLTIESDAHVYADDLLSSWTSRPTLRDLGLRAHILRRARPSTGPRGGSASDQLLQDLASVDDHAPLRALELGGRVDVSDAGLVPLLREKGGTLRSLELADCPKLTGRTLRTVGQCCPLLEHLTIRRSSGTLTDPVDGHDSTLQPLEEVARGCRYLQKLVLSELCAALPTTPSFSCLPHLVDLSLTRVSLRPSFLGTFPRLRRLSLCGCRVVDTENVGLPVERWPELEALSVLSSNVTIDEMRGLVRSATRLRKVSIDGVAPALIPSRLQLPTPPLTHPSSTRSYFPESGETSPIADRLNVLSPTVDPSALVAVFSSALALQSLALFGFAWDPSPPPTRPSSASTSTYSSDRHDSLLSTLKRPPLSQRAVEALALWTDVAWRIFRALLLLDPAPLPSFYWAWAACLDWTGHGQKRGRGKGPGAGGGGRARLSTAEVDQLKRANPSLINVWV